jgi:hypothetical protein
MIDSITGLAVDSITAKKTRLESRNPCVVELLDDAGVKSEARWQE